MKKAEDRELHATGATAEAGKVLRKEFSRRAFTKLTAAYGAGVAGLLSGFAGRSAAGQQAADREGKHLDPSAPVEYIVIGSGGGGGPLACNLAVAGHKVVLVEAGGFEAQAESEVPAYGSKVVDDPTVRWDFYVRHYADQALQDQDPKYLPQYDGVWYPRSGTVGGCTLHNVLVDVYPNNSDWTYIEETTGDRSWNPENMRRYFQRIDQSRISDPAQVDQNRHGYNGWLTSEYADLSAFANDPKVVRILTEVAREVDPNDPETLLDAFFKGSLDVSDWRNVEADRAGFYNMAQFMRDGKRRQARDYIRETMAAYPNNLTLKTYTLATRVLFDDTTAIGIEYVEGQRLYRADPNPSSAPLGPKQTLLASREVIVAGGAFNSPQILKLSGIGPSEELNSFGIPVVVDLPGVGENLQDRYEISVITQLQSNLTLRDCIQGTANVCYADWQEDKGYYTSSGAMFTSLWKTETARAEGRLDPDVFMYVQPGPFRGYVHGYSVTAAANNQYTFKIIKCHTDNTQRGTVKLRSNDPRDTPLINFNYFSNTTDMASNPDLSAVVDGLEIVRRINGRLGDIAESEIFPGASLATREQLAEFVVSQSWGHHCSCSNKMGPREDRMAVVDSKFRVHGTRNLRVVDASIFPKIPGYFVMLPIYIIGEKASEAILKSAGHRERS